MICLMKKTQKLDCLYLTMKGRMEENRSTSFPEEFVYQYNSQVPLSSQLQAIP